MRKLLTGCLFALACTAVADYVPVEWIQSDASQTQWLNTGHTPHGTDRIEMKIRLLSIDNTAFFGVRRDGAYTFTAFASVQGNVMKFRFDHRVASSHYPATVQKDVDYVITMDGKNRQATVMQGETKIVDAEIGTADGSDFPLPSDLALLALNDLSPSKMNYPASAILYYVKIYDGEGNLIRDYVPVRNDAVHEGFNDAAGLYDNVTKTFIGNSGGGAFMVGPAVEGAERIPSGDGEEEDAVYEVIVDEGQTVALTAADVTAASDKVLVKKGPGTLTVDDVMKDFTGDIRIEEGYYVVQSSGALGTADGKTSVLGGTLVNEVERLNYSDPVVFADEEIHLYGTGENNQGALWCRVECENFAKNIVLDGNALMRLENQLDFRGTTFTMNKNKLTVDAPTEASALRFNTVSSTVAMKFVEMGDVEIRGKGSLWFIRDVQGIASQATVTTGAGAQLHLYEVPGSGNSPTLKCNFVFEDGAQLVSSSGSGAYGGDSYTINLIHKAEFQMSGLVTNRLAKNGQWAIGSKMTGPGGIVGGRGGYMKVYEANTFTGGLDISGVVENGDPVGGVITYKNLAIPYSDDAGPLKLKDANLRLYGGDTFYLPDFVAAGRVVVSNAAVVKKCGVRSVTKTGDEELTVFGPFNVQKAASFDAGTVRLVPQAPAGTAAEDASNYRMSFAENVAFGPGVVFDVGDQTPYQPIAVPSLTGLPTVRNGALAVASATWTIRKSDILDAANKPLNKPMTLSDDAALTFPAGLVTIDLSEEDAVALKPLLGTVRCPLIADVSAFPANTFKLSDTAKTSGFGLTVQNNRLIFGMPPGLLIIVR